VQNIGAYGEDVSEVISRVQVLDRDSNRIEELANADCGFTYRSGIFNTTHKDRYIILSVDFSLRPDGLPRIDYPEPGKNNSQAARIHQVSATSAKPSCTLAKPRQWFCRMAIRHKECRIVF